jgi:RNA polymerase-binding transcription factor DksA
MASEKVISASALKSLRERLEKEKQQLVQQLEMNRSNLKDLTEFIDVESAQSNHPADVATATEQQQGVRTESDFLENRLRGAEEALTRMEEGSYGACVDCGKAIPQARLEASPLAIRDIECQREFEAKQRVGTPTRPASAAEMRPLEGRDWRER